MCINAKRKKNIALYTPQRPLRHSKAHSAIYLPLSGGFFVSLLLLFLSESRLSLLRWPGCCCGSSSFAIAADARGAGDTSRIRFPCSVWCCGCSSMPCSSPGAVRTKLARASGLRPRPPLVPKDPDESRWPCRAWLRCGTSRPTGEYSVERGELLVGMCWPEFMLWSLLPREWGGRCIVGFP